MAVQASSPTKTTRPPTRFRWWWLAVGAAVLLVAGVMAFAIFKPIKVLPRMRQAPGFILTDQDGQRLTSEDVRGKVVVYNFLYTGCGSACDPMNATMQEVQRRLDEVDLTGLPVQFVTISFDPEHDTPEKLKAYADSLDADPTRWRFATGDATRLKQIIGTGFEAYYQADGQGAFQFDPKFVLVDGLGTRAQRVQIPGRDLRRRPHPAPPRRAGGRSEEGDGREQTGVRGGAFVFVLCELGW